MGIFDAFGQIEQLMGTQFEHESLWLTIQNVQINFNPTICPFSGVITQSSNSLVTSPSDLLVAGAITPGTTLFVGTHPTDFNIAFTASPRAGGTLGQRQYQGAIRPIDPTSANPKLFKRFFLAGTYTLTTSSFPTIPGHPPTNTFNVGPFPFAVTLPAAL
jgi:hypothetical protein